jgi:hypothetical protein
VSPVYRTGAFTCLATGQLAASESNRAIPVHQTGPVDQLGRGQRMRQESNLQGSYARPGSGRVPSPVGWRILKRRDRESDPEGSSHCSTVFETAAVASRLASPGRMAQDSNLPAACTATSGFQPGTLPTRSAILERSMKDSNLRTGHPVYAVAGRCRSRWANAPCVPSLGLEPRRPMSETGGSANLA